MLVTQNGGILNDFTNQKISEDTENFSKRHSPSNQILIEGLRNTMEKCGIYVEKLILAVWL